MRVNAVVYRNIAKLILGWKILQNRVCVEVYHDFNHMQWSVLSHLIFYERPIIMSFVFLTLKVRGCWAEGGGGWRYADASTFG
jgi:hypothetical protein